MFGFLQRFFVSIVVKIINMFQQPATKYHRARLGSYWMTLPIINHNAKLDYKVYLEFAGGRREDITQPPGTPYRFSPSDYGALEYVTVSTLDNKTVFRSTEPIEANCRSNRRAISN